MREDGLYPFELISWETGGGAEVEFFSLARATGQRILINDTGNTSAINARLRPSNHSPQLVTYPR